MDKIEIATNQDLYSINKLRETIRASFTNYDLDLKNIEYNRMRITFVNKSGGQLVGYLTLHLL